MKIEIYGLDKKKISIITKMLDDRNIKYDIFEKVRFAGDPTIVIDNIIYNYTQAYYYIKYN